MPSTIGYANILSRLNERSLSDSNRLSLNTWIKYYELNPSQYKYVASQILKIIFKSYSDIQLIQDGKITDEIIDLINKSSLSNTEKDKLIDSLKSLTKDVFKNLIS